ncbi:BTAD domain-containing putative transcriptional regulator [Deinococcus sp. RIT780]|uniref:BTAD domain-containing putative transcriptional regulator n=1 Tax=Deinococcus sp. RIT780 TaxID=2870472 RepID=UPI001C8B02A5|nr:BTAD domain-containing putative transcriptional regulator [Deinococcus sp. RIT780]MBX8463554.1 hypothetical protein [Deinococcus sp. RIT780]
MSLSPLTGLYARIPRPVRHELHRTGLIARLRDSDVPLIILCAPGGYGKTTLLAQFARSMPGQVVWLSVREEDADPQVLCERVGAGIRQVLPTLPLTQFDEMRVRGRPPGVMAAALATDLSLSTTNLNLMIDGADTLGPASGKWLGALVDDLPEGHRMFVSARSAQHLDAERRFAAATALILDARDLAFTENETAACLQGADASAGMVGQSLDGWPLAVNVAASGRDVQGSVRDVLRGVLESLPRDIQVGLPDLAVLEVWTEQQAVALDLRLPVGWLSAVRHAGLPLTPIADTVRPHALLRDLLEERLRADVQRHAELHGRAGGQAEQQGELWQALRHYQAARRPQEQQRLARELARRYQERWEPRLTVQVLGTLPDELMTAELSVMLGKALIDSGDVPGGSAVLRELHAAGIRHSDIFYGLGALAARSGEDETLLRLAEDGLTDAHDARAECRLLRLKATALFNLGHLDDAMTAAQSALMVARGERDTIELGAVLDIVQVIHKYRQEWTDCEAALRAGLRIYADAGMPSRAVMLQNNLADLLVRRGHFAEALNLIQEALPTAERERSVVQGLLLETTGEILGHQGQYAEAQRAFEQALAVFERFEVSAFVTRVWPSLVQTTLYGGDIPSARSLTAQWALTGPVQPHAQQALLMCRGLLAFHAQDWQAAMKACSGITDGNIRPRATLLSTAAAWRAGILNRDGAEVAYATLRAAQPHQFWPDDVAIMQDVAEACRQLGVPSEWVQPLASWSRCTPGHTEPVAPVLRVRTLGPVSVTVNAARVHVPLSRSVELLVWLALHRDGGTRGDIMNDLWDGSSEPRHIEYFKVAIRHLRAALASAPDVNFNPVPFEQGRYRLAPEFRVETDVLLFSSVMEQPTVEGLQQLIDAYQGPFLPASDAPWVDHHRTELLDRTLAAAAMLVKRLGDQPERAAAALERTLELDPLQEVTYVKLIELWEGVGEPAAARRCYARYARMLASEWNRLPEPALQARYG